MSNDTEALKAAAEAVLEFEGKKNPLATGNRYRSTVLEDGFASHATPTAILSLIARVEGLEAENLRLKVALKPFADEAKTLSDIDDDQRLVYPGAMNIGTGKEAISDFTVGDLRAARAALEVK